MQQKIIAIVGFGDLGERLSGLLPADKWHCLGLRRTANAVPEGVESIAIDLGNPPSLGVLAKRRPDALLIALSPSDRSAQGYEAGFADAMTGIVAGLGDHVPERALFVSSTRVYREAGGGWVDEDSATVETDPRGAAILAAERTFLEGVENSVVLRAGGLYGNGPGPLLKRVASGRLTPSSPPRYGNRIHRDDVAGFMAAVLQGQATVDAPIINLVDDAPVPLQEMEAWLCSELGMPYDPPGPEAGSDPPGHKRISNGRLHRSGYALQYPDYRAGYGLVLHRWMAHSEREDGLDLH